MTTDLPQPIRAILAAYLDGDLDEDALRTRLTTTELAEPLRTLTGRQLSIDADGTEQVLISRTGDTITTGSFTNASGNAIGRGAVAVGELVINFIVTLPTAVVLDSPNTRPAIDIPHLPWRAEWQIGRDDDLDALHTGWQDVVNRREPDCADYWQRWLRQERPVTQFP